MMTPEDRRAIEGLFDRLAAVEQRAPDRDYEAAALIKREIDRQPAAPYYMAQTILVQQHALEAAERRIEELERQGRRPAPYRNPWDRQEDGQQAYDGQQQGYGGYQRGFGGGGFLGGAMQTALGVAGGVLLGNAIGSLFGAGGAHASEGGDHGVDAGSHDNVNDLDQGVDQDTGTDSGGDWGDFGGGDGGFDIGGDF